MLIKKIIFFFLFFLNIDNLFSKEEKIELFIFASASIIYALAEFTVAYNIEDKKND